MTSAAVDTYSKEYCEMVSSYQSNDIQDDVEFCAGDLAGEKGACNCKKKTDMIFM